jgi:c-di-GMP-binding flagellar brake protein YcgR
MVNLPGTCFYIRRGRVIQGKLKVMDLSTGGMKVKLDMDRKPQVGESLNLEFHLDDKNRTLIKTRVKVRSIKEEYIGTAFESDIGPELGFYLMG